MKILPVKQNVGQGWFLVLGIKAFLEARGVDRGCIITNFESELVV